MKVVQIAPTASLWPDPWQLVIIAICTLVLCSCRSNPSSEYATSGIATSSVAASGAGTAGNSVSGRNASVAGVSNGSGNSQANGLASNMVQATSYTTAASNTAASNTAPSDTDSSEAVPRIPLSYEMEQFAAIGPQDEYLRDGGDKGMPVKAGSQSQVLGLEMEDTVAQFKTKDGRTLVQPSNEVHIYSPRFGAVRQVVGVMENEERQKATGVHEPTHLSTPEYTQIVAGSKQNVQLIHEVGTNPAVALRSKQGDGVMSNALKPRGFEDRFRLFENLSVVRLGVYEESETAMLARGSTAAIAWSHDQAVQVFIDHQNATADVKYDQSMSLYTVFSPPGRPRLQLVKLASTATAKPGEVVDFTLRFDNTGTDTIREVTLLDSLSTRLEYVPDSAQCSLEAQFSVVPNEGDSVVFRCEVKEPLEPGHGGVVRFRCRVR
jgi:uncharacterized repeat protein (TIGR01451 family)